MSQFFGKTSKVPTIVLNLTSASVFDLHVPVCRVSRYPYVNYVDKILEILTPLLPPQTSLLHELMQQHRHLANPSPPPCLFMQQFVQFRKISEIFDQDLMIPKNLRALFLNYAINDKYAYFQHFVAIYLLEMTQYIPDRNKVIFKLTSIDLTEK